MRVTTNRTLWPIGGGAVALQPGWFQGHATAFFYINLGFGTDGPDGGPPNMSFPMVPVFQITGPSKGPYPGTFCLPQIPLPVNTTVNVGDNATIQVVETAVHGAALFNVSSPQTPSGRDELSLKTHPVRRHNLRQSRRCARSQCHKLLQLIRHRLQRRLHRLHKWHFCSDIIKSAIHIDACSAGGAPRQHVMKPVTREQSIFFTMLHIKQCKLYIWHWRRAALLWEFGKTYRYNLTTRKTNFRDTRARPLSRH